MNENRAVLIPDLRSRVFPVESPLDCAPKKNTREPSQNSGGESAAMDTRPLKDPSALKNDSHEMPLGAGIPVMMERQETTLRSPMSESTEPR